MNKRETKFSNQILYNLLKDYSVIDIKILSCMINRLITKYKSLEDKKNQIEVSFLELGISLEFFKEYKGKKNLTRKDIENILKKICCIGIQIYEGHIYTRINIIKKIEYNERYKSFRIYFNDDAIDYLILIHDNFTLLDLNILKEFSGKYELGLYILIQMFKSTGKIIKKIDDFKTYFAVECENKILLNNIRNGLFKLNNKINLKTKIEYEKKDNKVVNVIITFKKYTINN